MGGRAGVAKMKILWDYFSMASEAYEQIQRDQMEFDRAMKAARQISRNTIYRVVLLSSGIVGFSVSLFSISALQQSLDLKTIQYSWYLFLTVIILGVFILLAEGRIRFALTWKSHQVSQWTDSLKDYSAKEQILAWAVVVWSLVYPSNLTFNKIKTDQERQKFEQRVNGLVVHRLARLGLSLAILENLFFVVFVMALIILVGAFVIPSTP